MHSFQFKAERVAAIAVVFGMFIAPAQAQTFSAPVISSTTATAGINAAGTASNGANGLNGYSGNYYCNEMTWGIACVAFFKFGSYTTISATAGLNAPSGGETTQIGNENPQIVTVSPSGSAASGNYSVNVTRLAAAQQQSTGATSGLLRTDVLNGGAAFQIVVTPENGAPQTLNMGENSTLSDVQQALAGAGFTASIETVTDNETTPGAPIVTDVLTVKGAEGAGNNYTIQAYTDGTHTSTITELAFAVPASVTVLRDPSKPYDAVTNPYDTYVPLGVTSQDAEYIVTMPGGSSTTYTSPTNNSTPASNTITGLSFSFRSTGTAALQVNSVSTTIGNGANGAAGNAGDAWTDTGVYSSVSTPGQTAFDVSRTGGQGGSAQQGGAGGQGGTGGAGKTLTVPVINVALIFPTPSTRDEGIQGGVGGNGADGGSGGVGGVGGAGGALSLTLAAGTANVESIARLVSTGGVGGAGGQGGNGGQGGTGGAGAAKVESYDLVPVVTVAAGNVGGQGGRGGIGGIGATGGAGGAVTFSGAIANAAASGAGLVLDSTGGQGGSGGQGGTGGRGGTGGAGAAAAAALVGGRSTPGLAAGSAGAGHTGGEGGVGGAGGVVSATFGGNLVAATVGIQATSKGGKGGTGGTGGTGGVGGTGGAGAAATDHVNSNVAGGGGTGGAGGAAGAGGQGGIGGAGGSVTVTTTDPAAIIQAGHNAILAQSFGGVGGAGGAGGTGGAGGVGGAGAGSASVGGSFAADGGAGGAGGTGGAGGNGGAGGAGGTVQVTNVQQLVTTGTSNASAILAQSLGAIGGAGGLVGVGGEGGVGGSGGETWFDVDHIPTNRVSWSQGATGAAGTASTTAGTASTLGGAGGAVTVTNSGAIATSGSRSDAITAVSAGGVYGLTGFLPQSIYWDGMPVGAQQGGSGAVSVGNTANLLTTGANSTGVMALSHASGAASGDVGVTNNGSITTTGAGSSAIVAESRVHNIAGAAPANAGNVNVNHSVGTLSVSGAGASAIKARSTSSSGAAGAVTATTSGTVVCAADSCTAVELESSGATTNGNISLTNSGTIQGGASGTGVAIIGGATNQVINDGASAKIITASGVWATAISGTTGNDAVINRNGGLIEGNILLGTGVNSLLNDTGSFYNSGNTIDLGGGLFTNNGTFSPGRLGTTMAPGSANGITTLTGDFVQNTGARYVVDLDFAPGAGSTDTGDFMQVTGTAVLAGYITLEPSNGAGKPGTFVIPVLNATGGITGTGMTIDPQFASGGPSTTAVFKPTTWNDGYTQYVGYDIDYMPTGLTPNGSNVGSVINDIQNAGVPSFRPIADELLRLPTLGDLQNAYDSLSGEGAVAGQQTTLGSRGQNTSNVLARMNSFGFCNEQNPAEAADCKKNVRTWFDFSRAWMEQTGNPNTATTRYAGNTSQAGADFRYDGTTMFGFAFNYSNNQFAVPGRWTTGNVEGVAGTAYGMITNNSGFYGKALVSVGHYENSTERYAMGRQVKGNYASYAYGASVEGGVRQRFGNVSFTPFIGYHNDNLVQPNYSEDHATFGNRFDAVNARSSRGAAGLTVDADFALSGNMRLGVTGGLSYEREFNRARSMMAGMNSAPDFKWKVDGLAAPADKLLMNFGIDLRAGNAFVISLSGHKGYTQGISTSAFNVSVRGMF